MKAIILAGGAGTRLWPLSRTASPKQFLSLVDDKSLLQLTAERLAAVCDHNDLYVVSPPEYKDTIVSHLTELFGRPFTNLILEPAPRNTAPAISLAVKNLLESRASDPEDILLFCPADHLITPVDRFAAAVKEALGHYTDKIITFGIKPHTPETGYGYIELGDGRSGPFAPVSRFIEKPDPAAAARYAADEKYVWNSGIFMFSIRTILEELEKFAPHFHRFIVGRPLAESLDAFASFTPISIDFALMEKTPRLACLPLEVDWNDVGSWDALYRALPKDGDSNVLRGDVFASEVKNSLIIGKSKLMALHGLTDVIAVEAEDAVLFARRDDAQAVKKIVGALKAEKRPEVEENVTTYRPWGSYTILEKSARYKIKKIIVNVGAFLSLQKHFHRSEHWIIVKGTAAIQIGRKKIHLHENESAFVPKSIPHRLGNPGKVPLEIIEVQNGEYVGEDDIERLKDDYHRL